MKAHCSGSLMQSLLSPTLSAVRRRRQSACWREEGGSQEGREGGDGDDRRNALCPMCHSSLCGRNVCVCAPVLRVCAHAEQPCARTHAAVFSPDSMRLLRSLISSRFVRPAVSHLTPPSLPPSQASGSDMACLPGTD